MPGFNRKDRLMISKKLGRRFKNRKNLSNRFCPRISSMSDESQHDGLDGASSSGLNETEMPKNIGRWYSISLALPGSILNNVQTRPLMAYVSGQIARACAIFSVEEIIVFDESAVMSQSQIDAYLSGKWDGTEPLSPNNAECNFHLARILEYMECPQYLRKHLFPFQEPLKHSGLMNPLCGLHHFKAEETAAPYREGIILTGRSKKDGSLCDVGLSKPLELIKAPKLPPNMRITVKINSKSIKRGDKLLGSLVSAKSVREESGIPWGYNVRIARSLSEVVAGGSYDFVVGTSEYGQPLSEINFDSNNKCSFLIVVGGLRGLEFAIQHDPNIKEKNPNSFFQHYVNCLPDQGSRTIRTEEAIPIVLTALKYKLDQIGKIS